MKELPEPTRVYCHSFHILVPSDPDKWPELDETEQTLPSGRNGRTRIRMISHKCWASRRKRKWPGSIDTTVVLLDRVNASVALLRCVCTLNQAPSNAIYELPAGNSSDKSRQHPALS